MTSSVRKLLVVVALAGCAAAVVWMYRGNDLVGNANIVGGLAGVAALTPAVVALWPRSATVPADGDRQRDAAVEYLARETLSVWRGQAKARRVTTPAPALVSWRWAGPEVAAPAVELGADQDRPVLLTQGEVTRLRELYEGLPKPGRVVLLGGPGAGKTTAMLLLLIDVLSHRTAGSAEPVPMWLTMGGWKPEMPLLDWVATVVNRDFPGLAGYAGRGTAADLLRSGRIAVFLDGLDELPDDLRGPALRAIDEAAPGVPVVLTSRPGEYEAATGLHRLWNAAVVDLLPVDIEDACTFLLNQQVGARREAWQKVTDHLRRHPGSVAARTLRDPLALNLARDTYTATEATPTDLLDHPSPEALRRHLLGRVLTLAYPDPAEYAHAVFWLTWIADRLGRDRDIRWWEMPAWLPETHRKPDRRVCFLGGLIGGLVGGLTVGIECGLVGGVMFALVVWLAGREGSEPRAVAARRPDRWVPAGIVAAGLAGGIVGGLLRGPMWTEARIELLLFVVVVLVGGHVGALAGWLVNTLTRWPGSEPRAITLRRPARRELAGIITRGLRGPLKGASVFGLLVGLAVGFLWEFRTGVVSGVVAGLLVWFAGALVAWVSLVLNLLWSRPLPAVKAVTPGHSYRADRRCSVVVGLAGALVVGLVARALGSTFGLTVGLAFGLSIGRGPAYRLAVAEVRSALRRRPVRFMRLLRVASERQVLRQAGTVYQFRHAALQDLLSSDERFQPFRDRLPVRPSRPRRPTRTKARRRLLARDRRRREAGNPAKTR